MQIAKPGQGSSTWGGKEAEGGEERDLSLGLLSWLGLIWSAAAALSTAIFFFWAWDT